LVAKKLKAPVLEFKDGIKEVPDEIKKKIRSKTPLEYKLVYLLTFSDIILSLAALCVPGYKVAFLRSHWIHYVIIYTMLYFKYRKLRYEYFLLDYCYFANKLILLYIWVFPQSKLLHTVCFGV